MIVRKAFPADFRSLSGLNAQLAAGPVPKRSRRDYRDLLGNQDAALLVCAGEHRVIGFAVILFFPGRGNPGCLAIIRSFAVFRFGSRFDAARRLEAEMERLAKEACAAKLSVAPASARPEARAFFLKKGVTRKRPGNFLKH